MATIRKRAWTSANGVNKSAWQVDYKDQNGRRRSKQFARKKDAEAWSANAIFQVQRGIHTADSASITVEQAAGLWLDGVKANDREPTTIAAYEQQVRLHIIPRCGAKKLSQLTAPIVRALLDDWLSSLSRSMAMRVFRSFKAILSDAQERGLIAQNVALAVKIRKASREKERARPPSKAELRSILTAADAWDDLKGRALVELAIFSGMRASELRGLSWGSIDLVNAKVTVSQRADARGRIGPPKSRSGHRTIPLPKRAVAALREWKLACPHHALDLVFPSEKGLVLSHSVMMKNYIDPILIAAGVTKETDSERAKYAVHVFRHAAVSLWIDHRMNPKRIQTLVGHGSIQVTFDTYGHLFDEAEKDAQDADAIERAIFTDAT